jgi:predicted Holliday junction resolvase-like endonuclease
MATEFRPRLLLIIVCALIIVLIFVITSLKQDLEEQLQAARQAVNEQTLLQSALVKLLVEKNIIARDDLLREAQAISNQFREQSPTEAPAAEPPFDTTGLAPPATTPAGQ